MLMRRRLQRLGQFQQHSHMMHNSANLSGKQSMAVENPEFDGFLNGIALESK